MPAQNPIYRNNRRSFYSEKGPDLVSVGTVINVFKTKPNDNSFDSQYVPSSTPVNGTSAYLTAPGNAQPENNPDYQYYGYLYCDGSEYNISDYPLLYSIIGNKYGGTPTQGITQENVFENWPDPSMGTFKVPDLKAKKVVGYGPVYGPGTPTIGNVEMSVGATGGFWYLSKETQKGYFNLGNIKTTGYTDVAADVSGFMAGYQEVRARIDDNDLNGPPNHSHYLLHSEAPAIQGFNSQSGADPYVVGYQDKTGKTIGFAPGGGIKLTHSHALSKDRLSGTPQPATYDKFNWQGGDSGPGTLNPAGNYYASGSSGEFRDVTSTLPPISKVFDQNSVVGGVIIIVDGGTPFYDEQIYEFESPGPGQPLPLSANVDILEIEVRGGGGSGGVWTQSGNNGQSSSVLIGDGSGVTITAGAGSGGQAAQENTSVIPYTEVAGGGGSGGTNSVTGTYAADVIIDNNSSNSGTKGSDGKFWNGQHSQPDATWYGYGGLSGSGLPGAGSTGQFLTISASARGTVVDHTYPSSGPWAANSTDARFEVLSARIYLWGSRGRDCQNLGGTYTTGVGQYSTNSGGCSTGVGGVGKYVELSVKPNPTTGLISGAFEFYPGQSGQVFNATSGTTYGAGIGGRGGDGYLQDGGGGGAASVVQGGTTIVAGAGGGGGGGGAGEGQCGDSGSGNPINNGVQAVTQNLFLGGGGTGGDYGCTGGGGGGGGGGVGLASQAGGSQGGGDSGGATAGGDGGGGGGFGGHGGGYGGARGLSSYNSNYFELISSGDVDHTSTSGANGSGTIEGRIRGVTTENRSYWSSAAGGGGAGGYIKVIVPETVMTAINPPSVTINVGNGGDAVSKSLNRTIDSSISWTESASTTSSSSGGSGYVKVTTKTYLGSFGGSESTSVGDIVIKASAGVQLFSSGSGQGTTGGFKLPTTQVPTVQIVAQGDQPGSGATATALVSNGVVVGITLGDPGSGYISNPVVKFLNGAGGGTKAIANINSSGSVESISLVSGSSTAYTRYVRMSGPELERFVVISAEDCTDVKSFAVKCARGNNINGGELPDDSGDQLLLYYNIDGSLNFPETKFIGVLVPRPSPEDIAFNYDGDGQGGNTSTLWYTYSVDLPPGAQTTGVRFKIIQKRSTATGSNDNASSTDHFGIAEFIYYKKFTSQTQFFSSPGELSSDARTLTYIIEGSQQSRYSAGIDVNDMRFTLSAGVPINPVPALDPVTPIPLLEPYALTKYLIKAF